MKKIIALLFTLCLLVSCAWAQSKHEKKKNLVVKEWRQKADGKDKFLDQQITYDPQGRKIEDVEYASYGQKRRTVYEYDGDSRLVKREVEYDDKNHVVRIRKFEYNADGSRKMQYNYKPNGTLISVREYEYTYK